MDASVWHEPGTPEEIQRIIDYAREQAYLPDRVDYTPCYSRGENAFVYEHDIEETDIRNCIDALSLEQFSHISKETGKTDAYVFGVHLDWLEPLIYMKLKIRDGIVVVSFHEPKHDMTFPYRNGGGE